MSYYGPPRLGKEGVKPRPTGGIYRETAKLTGEAINPQECGRESDQSEVPSNLRILQF